MNAAGASPMAEVVHDAIVAHLELERQVGGYAAEATANARQGARRAAAELLGCDETEIALTESAQAAWAKAFYSLDFQEGDRIFCWESEYAGNAVAFLQAARQHKLELEILPMRTDGIVDVAALDVALKSMPASARSVVALTHIQTNSSIVQPAASVGELARKHGAVFLLDACQSIGQIPVNVRSLSCDFACGTGRKWLRGPRGTGFLYARAAALPQSLPGGAIRKSDRELVGEPAMIDHVSVRWTQRHAYDLTSSAQRYEMWESAPALHVGLKEALMLCSRLGPQQIGQRASHLARSLRQRLACMQGIRCCDAPESFSEDAESPDIKRCGIVTFQAFPDLRVTSEFIKDALAEQRIAVSVSPSSHTFNDADWSQPSTVRISPSYYNNESEVDAVARTIQSIISHAAVGAP